MPGTQPLSPSCVLRPLCPRQVACIMAVLIESRYPSPQEAASLVVISLGVMLAVWQVGGQLRHAGPAAPVALGVF